MLKKRIFLLAVLSTTAIASGRTDRLTVNADSLPAPTVDPWRVVRPDTAYHGEWLVAGDVNGDGRAEIITAHSDKQRVTAFAVRNLEGRELWHWGVPGSGRAQLGYDVPLQIYDLNGDGRGEVFAGVDRFLLVMDGISGREIKRWPLPEGLNVTDCITFADLRGLGRPSDILIKDRYQNVWAYTPDWDMLWHWAPRIYKTCHHPTPIDIDGDGRDEVLAGYSMLDDNGLPLWTLAPEQADLSRGHLDCCEIFKTGSTPTEFQFAISLCAAQTIAVIDGAGRFLWQRSGEHFESIDAGRLTRDAYGKQIAVDLDHRPYGDGLMWVLDERGDREISFRCDYCRHHRLIDWDGDGLDEILIGNARALFRGDGSCLVRLGPKDLFASDAGPQKSGDAGPLAAVGDLDGDHRPEVILHSKTYIAVFKGRTSAPQPGPVGTGINFTLY